jgi:hypothetical protein
VSGKTADRLLWRRLQIGEGSAEMHERLHLSACHQPGQDLIENGDLRLIQPVGAGEKQARYLPQHLTAACRRSAFYGAIKFGNKIVRGANGHPRHQFLFRCGTKTVRPSN